MLAEQIETYCTDRPVDVRLADPIWQMSGITNIEVLICNKYSFSAEQIDQEQIFKIKFCFCICWKLLEALFFQN